MSAPLSPPPPLLLLLPPLLLLSASVSAGPVDLLEVTPALSTLVPAAPETPAPASASAHEQQAVPAATLVPPSEGQYCTVNGAVFHNGARLPVGDGLDPGSDPCRACYCQGGEPVCTRLHCYRRPDCAPRHVAGRCCPKYDSCPPAPEDRSPEPRFRDASTQTDAEASTQGAETRGTPSDHVTQDGLTDATTTTTTAGATATLATVTTETSSLTATITASTWTTTDSTTEAPTDGPTDPLPPGIDLHALHEHLPFLSPGDANGPNT